MGSGVWDLGFGVWGLGSGVWGFGVWGLGFGVWGLGSRVWGLEIGVWNVVFGVWCFGVTSLERLERTGVPSERGTHLGFRVQQAFEFPIVESRGAHLHL